MDFASQPRYLGDAGSEYVKILDNFLEVLNNASTYMSVERRSHDFRPQPERQGSRGLPNPHTEQTQPLQGRVEGRKSLQGPTTVDRSEQLQAHQETTERQLLPNVWEVLERMVRLDAPDVDGRPRWGTQEYKREADEVDRLTTEIRKEGTAHDRLIFDLYSNITKELAPFPNPVDFRDLSLAEYRQFRSKVETLSEQELAEEIRKAKEEFERKSDEFFRSEGGDPPSTDSIVNT